MSEQSDRPGATGEVLLEAQFDRKTPSYLRWVGSFILLITIVGIPLIPLWLLVSFWYGSEYLRRVSTRLTIQAVEIRKGVFFRKEATIPLDRITDVRLYDDPLMRMHKLRGLKVETAGQSGQNAGSEGDLVGIIDAVEFRDAILLQRQRVLDAETSPAPRQAVGGTAELLTEIRDILVRIEAKS